MNIPTPQFTISREALQTVAAVAKIAKLEELHIVDSVMAQTLDWKNLAPAERMWMLVDMKGRAQKPSATPRPCMVLRWENSTNN